MISLTTSNIIATVNAPIIICILFVAKEFVKIITVYRTNPEFINETMRIKIHTRERSRVEKK
jgi:hypothetical protein